MDYSALCYILHLFCLSYIIDKQTVESLVWQQVSSAIFSFPMYFYDFFFLQYAALFHLFFLFHLFNL